MKLMTVTITAVFLISTTWAQGQHRQNGRKSEHMQTVDDITMVVPALEKYAKGPLPAMETPRPQATRPQHCYHRGPDREQPND